MRGSLKGQSPFKNNPSPPLLEERDTKGESKRGLASKYAHKESWRDEVPPKTLPPPLLIEGEK